jgi:hypothetical protein
MPTTRIGRQATGSIEYKDNKITKRFSQPYVVELSDDEPEYSGAEIVYAVGLPRPGRTTYSPRPGIVIPFAICTRLTPKFKSKKLWEVLADFEYTGDDDEESKEEDDFPNLAPKIEPFTDSIQVPIYRDWDGLEIVDPLGDLFEQPTLADIALPGVRVTRYVDSFDENTLAAWKWRTNATAWRGQPEDAWLCREATGQEVEVGPFTLGQITLEFVSNPLELLVNEEMRRVGWLDVRKLESEDFLTEEGKRLTNRNNVGTIRRTKIDADGQLAEETQYLLFRKFRQAEFNDVA